MVYEKQALLGFGDLDKQIFGVVFSDALGQVLIGFVQFRRLVDQMEEAEGIELEQVDDWLVVLEPNIV